MLHVEKPFCGNEAYLIAGIHRANKQRTSNGSGFLWLIKIPQKCLGRPDTVPIDQTLQTRGLEHPNTLEIEYLFFHVQCFRNDKLLFAQLCASLWLFF